jgi:predicted MFS family arabinose efflux permease
MATDKSPGAVLALIVIAQFAGTSLWFAGNAVVGDIIVAFALPVGVAGHILSAVQFGFITGTLVFSILAVTDRFRSQRLFFMSAFIGSLANLAILFQSNLASIVATRFVTGFCLAGIYPVGVKIASDHFERGLGKALGYLVGALVLGTALPHLVKAAIGSLSWMLVIIFTSVAAFAGGVIVLLLVPDGKYQSRVLAPDLRAVYSVFRNRNFRKVSFGYFGHMWELYTFWGLVPTMLGHYNMLYDTHINVPLVSFILIASGALSCVLGGYISQRLGSYRTAGVFLAISLVCCLLSPSVFYLPQWLFLCFLLLWSMAVVADSPQFSTLVASSVTPDVKGTALTISYSIGFFLTIISIQLLQAATEWVSPVFLYILLVPGPLLGLIAMRGRVVSA